MTTSTLTLTREQAQAAGEILKGLDKQQVHTLGGAAGTGKSVVVQHLAQALPHAAVCAFTGKAAHVLLRRGVPATTIHRLIYAPKKKKPEGGRAFRLKTRKELGCRCIVVDEASMVGDALYRDLLSFGVPVIFVGDHHQLPPVTGTFNVMADPDYRLERVHRNAGDIARFAEHLREGKPARSFRGGKRVRVVSPNDVTEEMLLGVDQVLCGFNKTRSRINQDVRKLLGRVGGVEVGDRVVCLRNSPMFGIFNGQQGTVLRVRHGRQPRFDLDTGGGVIDDVPFDPEQFGREKVETAYDPEAAVPFDFAHAVTCHKAQGDEWDQVLVVEQKCALWDSKR